ncbi:diguanylate cyclase [Gallaecimonas sp. GXIMD1310]|uniref:GGDEF domain-containing protein n=1 Tax=Gallaecimonas sp. GXIMD1310 TaxID=3131926 RepID=UPI003255B98B
MLDHSLSDIQQLLGVLDCLDVGLVVVDRQYRIRFWNEFMANHSGQAFSDIKEQPLFATFPELPEQWLRQKVDTVMALNTTTFTSWEQRPQLFPFTSYRPLTGRSVSMFQNLTFIPMPDDKGHVERVAIVVSDVTEAANSRQALEEANQRLSVLSRTDPLTGLLNRRSWENALQDEFNRCRRSGGTSALVMFDIDHFKQVNDEHGHQAGDKVLQHVAALLRETLRSTDKAGRYGGEEFALLLVDTNAEQAAQLAERLREKLAAHPAMADDKALVITISMGIAALSGTTFTDQDWVKNADRALYQAKHSGRDAIVMAD